jgi:hypothetical protein
MLPIHHRYVRLEGCFVRLQGVSMRYRAELSSSRYYKDQDISELDLRGGVVYIDVLNNTKWFYLASELRYSPHA